MVMQPFPIDTPYDVQRTLVEVAAYHDRNLAKKLAGLSKEVQTWVDPTLYRHVKIEYPSQADAFIRTLECSSKDSEFFARHVKILCFAYGVSLDQVARILSMCTGVKSLASWVEFFQTAENTDLNNDTPTKPSQPEELKKFIMNESSPLRRLSIILQDFFCTPDPDFDLPIIRNLTHLDIYQGSEHFKAWTWNGFKELTHLTHLSFDISISTPLDTISGLISKFPKNLQVCLVLISTRGATGTLDSFFEGNKELEKYITGEADRRIVIGTTEALSEDRCYGGLVVVHPYEEVVKDWTYTPDGKDDIWDKAAAVVARRDAARKKSQQKEEPSS